MTQRFKPLAREALAPDQQRMYGAIVEGRRGTRAGVVPRLFAVGAAG